MQINYRATLTKNGQARISYLVDELVTGNIVNTPDENLWHLLGKSFLQACEAHYCDVAPLNFDRPGIRPDELRSDLTGQLVQVEINLRPVVLELARRGDERFAVELDKIIKDADRELCGLYRQSASIAKTSRARDRLELYRVAVRETLEDIESLIERIREVVPNFQWGLHWQRGYDLRDQANLLG